jgi:hypothetical protein
VPAPVIFHGLISAEAEFIEKKKTTSVKIISTPGSQDNVFLFFIFLFRR